MIADVPPMNRWAIIIRRLRRLFRESNMDAFSEILAGVVLKGAMFFSAEFSAPWGFDAPAAQHLAPILAPGAPHLLVYHFLVEGSGLVRVKNESPIHLE